MAPASTPMDFGVREERAEGAKGGEPGPRRDIVPVNAAGRAKSFEEGMALAAESLDSGDTRGAGISD